jgi:hypothetical protein
MLKARPTRGLPKIHVVMLAIIGLLVIYSIFSNSSRSMSFSDRMTALPANEGDSVASLESSKSMPSMMDDAPSKMLSAAIKMNSIVVWTYPMIPPPLDHLLFEPTHARLTDGCQTTDRCIPGISCRPQILLTVLIRSDTIE